MPFESRPASLADIDFDDATYRVTTNDDNTGLAASIGQVGLLCPPILAAGRHGLRVVSGFRRLDACRRLGITQVTARVAAPGAGEWRRACWAVAENAGQRPLDPVERGRALRLLRDTAPDRESCRTAAAAFGLPDRPGTADRYTALCDLPDAVQRAVARGELAPATALTLRELDPAAAEALAGLLVSLRFGVNKQREVVELVLEIAARESVGVAAVLGEGEVRRLLSDPDADRPLKGRRLREHLRVRRFPRLAGAEARFDALRRELALPPEVRLDPPPGFEGRHYRLAVAFDDRRGLARHRDTLDRLLANPVLDRILELP